MGYETDIAEEKLPLYSEVFQIHGPKYVGETVFSQTEFLRPNVNRIHSVFIF